MEKSDEAKALGLITARLSERHPGTPHEVVEAVVRDVHHEFERSRVRDFVPLLVERAARERLRVEPPTSATG